MPGELRRVLILGATSAIAEAAARIWAAQRARLLLIGRGASKLEAIAADLKVRGASEVIPIALDCAAADPAVEMKRFVEILGAPDVVLLAYGVLGNQRQLESDPAAMADLLRTNFNSAASWCLEVATVLERRRAGALVVIGSVAGDRGRQSNYIYGASKAGLAVLVEGIAHRLAPSGARAVLVKPGFVDTPMTAAIRPKGLLWAKPEAIGAKIVKVADRGGPVVYAPAFWRAIMSVIRNVPSGIFHKTKL
jgi:decaprenylphospho-beta-D-erythro-pentofuranosid-2-ulose 2-reductase